MKSPLPRILRLRAVLEEASRSELEKRARLLQMIGAIQQAELQSASRERRNAFDSVADTNATAEQALQSWQQSHIAAELARSRAAKLGPSLLAAEQRTASGRAEYLERRKERLQVETILEEQEAQRQREADLRQQAMLDDWFAMRPR